MHPRDKCYRCGKDIYNSPERGQITISGYYTAYSGTYYYNYDLCEECHKTLNRIIRHYIWEVTDGNTCDPR